MARFAAQGLNLSDYSTDVRGIGQVGGATAAARAGETYGAFRDSGVDFGGIGNQDLTSKSRVRQAEMGAFGDLKATEIYTDGQVEANKIANEFARAAANKQANNSAISSGLGLVASLGGALLSDRRAKENIEAIDDALEKLRALKPCTFNYNEHNSNNPEQLHHGFIAQEYKEVMPDATYFDQSKQLYCIDPVQLIALLVRAIQQLDQRLGYFEAIDALSHASELSILGAK